MKLLLLAGLVLGQSLEYPKPNIREEQQVVVNGVTETWRLQWKSPPHPECDASEGMAMAITSPCQGFALGESGDLDVVRLRNGSEIDRLAITPLFTETLGGVMIRRWQPSEQDLDHAGDPEFAAAVAKRPTVQVIISLITITTARRRNSTCRPMQGRAATPGEL
jgi:hypothetical protein